MSTARRTLVRIVIGALLVAPAAAQSHSAADQDPGPVRLRGAEYYEALDNSQPRRLVGIEEDGNGFRQATPSLARGRPRPATVDHDELYRRKRAMYEEGQFFPNVIPATEHGPEDVKHDPQPPPGPRRTPLWRVCLCIALLGIATYLAKTALGSRR